MTFFIKLDKVLAHCHTVGNTHLKASKVFATLN